MSCRLTVGMNYEGQSNGDNGCAVTNLLGLKNEVCYCDDNDYCNASATTTQAYFLVSSLVIFHVFSPYIYNCITV